MHSRKSALVKIYKVVAQYATAQKTYNASSITITRIHAYRNSVECNSAVTIKQQKGTKCIEYYAYTYVYVHSPITTAVVTFS